MTTQYITYATEQEWHALRAKDVTSTESAALFNLSPYVTHYELWMQKASRLPAGIDDNERMQAGRHIEPAIASLVAERYGCKVIPFKEYARDPDIRMGASFDYITDDGAAFGYPGQPGILEMKNVDGLIFKRKWMDDETPAVIEIQLQHQLELTEYAWGAVMALVGGNRIVPYVRARDEAVGKAIRSRIRKFWASIDANKPPPIAYPEDAEVVIALNQTGGGDVFDARGDVDMSAWIANYDAASERERLAVEQKKVMKARILDRVGEASAVLWEGGKLSLPQVADSPGKLVTADMVGTYINPRRGSRQLRSYPRKED